MASDCFPPLIQRLIEEPHHFTFAQALFLLEKYGAENGKTTPIGSLGKQGQASKEEQDEGRAKKESVRIRPELSLLSQFADVVSVSPVKEHPGQFQLTTTLYGIYGTNSPLPYFYTENLMKWERDGLPYARDFLDLFHHCLLSLYYRASIRYRYDMQFVREGKDEISPKVLALMGLDESVLDRGLQCYADGFTQQGRSATALENLLSDYFSLPVSVEQFFDQEIEFHEADLSRLGEQNHTLGEDWVIGSQMLSCSGSFRIAIQLLIREQVKKFLPSGENFKALCKIVDLFLMSPLVFSVELSLPKDFLEEDFFAGQLGWTTWLSSPPPNSKIVLQP